MKNMSLFKKLKWIVTVIALFSCSLFWSKTGACEAPSDRFCVDFFQGKNLQGAPLESFRPPLIQHDWKYQAPGKDLPSNNFSARWRGWYSFNKGPYEFRIQADNGVRVFIDGAKVIDHWQNASAQEYHNQVIPGQGKHLVEVEYFEDQGKAKIEVDWSEVSDKKVAGPVHISGKSNSPVTHHVSQMTSKPPLGVNLSPFNYWTSSVPFKDLMKQSGRAGLYRKDSGEACRRSVNYDELGFPFYVPKGCVFRVWVAFHIARDEFWLAGTTPYQPGKYVLTYKGEGKIELGWDAKNITDKGHGRIEFEVPEANRGLQLEVSEIDPRNPVTDIHIVHIADELSYQQQPFNERWLQLLKPFSVIRFKDWGKIDQKTVIYHSKAIVQNSRRLVLPDSSLDALRSLRPDTVAIIHVGNQWIRVFVDYFDRATRILYLKSPVEAMVSAAKVAVSLYKFDNRIWAERALPGVLGQTGHKGLPFETMIQLANTLNVDPWISIPTAADNQFVENLAMMIKSQLNPALKCYIEYSNETWNFNYPGYDYSEAKARSVGLTGTVVPADAWHAYRAVEIFKIFNRVFAEADLRQQRHFSRLVRVLTSQTAWFDRAISVMDWKMPDHAWPTHGKPAYQYADAWAATAYFRLKDKHDLERDTMDELISHQIEDINLMFSRKNQEGILRRLVSEVDKRHLQLVIYEGGGEMLAPRNRPDLIRKAVDSNLDSKMRDVYRSMLNAWSRLYQEYGAQSVGVWMQYYDIGQYGQYGNWGLLQSTYQDVMTSPKYQAILDYFSQPEYQE